MGELNGPGWFNNHVMDYCGEGGDEWPGKLIKTGCEHTYFGGNLK